MEETNLASETKGPESREDTAAKLSSGPGKRKSDETEETEKNNRRKRQRGARGKKLRAGERYVPPPQKRNQGVSFSQEHFKETEYYFEGGLRKVRPYYFDFTSYCKGRWVGKSLLEVFKSEFRSEPVEYYQRAAKEGRIRLNDLPVKDLSVVLKVEKEYVCRVEGEFPEGELICEEPILVISFKIGICRVDPKGKESQTVFQRLSFNGKTSVVRCLPLTGRTHQIRVHLQYLGFPILNDPIYGSSAWGPHRGKGGQVGKNDEELLQALVEGHRTQESLHLLDIPDGGIEAVQELLNDNKVSEETESTSEPDKSRERQQKQVDLCDGGKEQGAQVQKDRSDTVNPTSSHCADDNIPPREEPQCSLPDASSGNQTQAPGTQDPLCKECKLVRLDPTEKELLMYLHALSYKGPDFEYSTCLPDWAKDDWVEAD